VKKTASGTPLEIFCVALGNLGTNRAVCLTACQNPKYTAKATRGGAKKESANNKIKSIASE
jgi:hypothetical protein